MSLARNPSRHAGMHDFLLPRHEDVRQSGYGSRELMPPIIYRGNRCNQATKL